MHHISRIYIANFGYKSCWYDGVFLDLLDKNTGDPTDHIIHMPNGGGKSTLLSAIFSCFETGQNRFLKHLQESRNRFSEYFSPDGVPALILVEWRLPSSGSQIARRVVTGQAVSIKNRHTNEIDRIFFSFEVTPDFSMESLPGPRLQTAQATSMEEFTKWLVLACSRRLKPAGIGAAKILVQAETTETEWLF